MNELKYIWANGDLINKFELGLIEWIFFINPFISYLINKKLNDIVNLFFSIFNCTGKHYHLCPHTSKSKIITFKTQVQYERIRKYLWLKTQKKCLIVIDITVTFYAETRTNHVQWETFYTYNTLYFSTRNISL